MKRWLQHNRGFLISPIFLSLNSATPIVVMSLRSPRHKTASG